MDKFLYYDSGCNLCNGFVNYCIKHNKTGDIVFLPLQSKYAEETLLSKSVYIDELKSCSGSVVYSKLGTVYLRSEAVFQIARDLDGYLPRIILIFSFLPRSIMDIFYNFIAMNRYRFFGKPRVCNKPLQNY